MINHHKLEHRFITNIPETLEAGVLYVSIEYATAIHSCCCGCGEEVVTPLSPTDWSLTFDGDTVSLSPSIGNWRLPCRSHYIIRRGAVIEAGPWSDERIEAAVDADHRVKSVYYGTKADGPPKTPELDPASARDGLWERVRKWFGR